MVIPVHKTQLVVVALRLTSTGQLPSTLSHSQTPTQSSPTQTMLGTVWGPQETLGTVWQNGQNWVSTTGTVRQQRQRWGQQCPATPNIPSWVFHNHGQGAECFMCQNPIAGYSHAPYPYKTLAQPQISTIRNGKNLGT